MYFLLLIGVGGILTVFSLNLFGHVRFLVPSSMTCTFIPPSLFYKPTITLPLAHLSYFAISESRTGSRYWIPRPRLYEFTCHLHSCLFELKSFGHIHLLVRSSIALIFIPSSSFYGLDISLTLVLLPSFATQNPGQDSETHPLHRSRNFDIPQAPNLPALIIE